MKDRLASMPFFVGDCLGSMSVRLMTLAERGADIHLLCLNRQQGRLENGPKERARWLDCSLQRFHQIWKGISHKIKEDAQRRIYDPWVEAVKQQCLARGRKLALAEPTGPDLPPSSQSPDAERHPRPVGGWTDRVHELCRAVGSTSCWISSTRESNSGTNHSGRPNGSAVGGLRERTPLLT